LALDTNPTATPITEEQAAKMIGGNREALFWPTTIEDEAEAVASDDTQAVIGQAETVPVGDEHEPRPKLWARIAGLFR
jgi:hypothetical protein